MSTHPVTELLIRRWGLPPAREARVLALLDDCEKGATAIPLDKGDAEADWGGALVAAGLGAASEPRPLVLVREAENAFLQTWMHHQAETSIAGSLKARIELSRLSPLPLSAEAEALLRSLFVREEEKDPYLGQFNAARTALTQRFSLITGGPGTGKTSTLARILAMLLHTAPAGKKLRIALGAPTGKAAERMREAVEHAVDEVTTRLPDLREPLLQAARSSTTLHRLLGYNPSSGTCKHKAANPLRLDVLVIDEASMIDVMLWRALLDATPLDTRLIVLGDPWQLESVAAGRVLADLVEAANGDSPLGCCWERLSKSFRFEKRPDIARLADLIGFQNADSVDALLTGLRDESAPGGVAWLGDMPQAPTWKELPSSVREALSAIARAPGPAEALEALRHVCLLSAHREHAHGALGLSAMIEAHMVQSACRPGGHLHNQPIIINQNDSETGLNNGSVGIICPDPVQGRLAWFPSPERESPPRSFPLGKLPDHSPAWALTIHRSQGSEYDHVYVLLPRSDSPLATRELIYTAITRARQNVYLAGSLETIRQAVSSEQLRTTCLRRLLTD